MTPNILIVDDHVDICELISALFETTGAKTKTLLKSTEAPPLVKASAELDHPFDMIVVDIMMPEMNGFELSAKLREDGYDGPIIAVTSALDGFGRKKGKESGITTYLSKSTLSPDLIKALLSTHNLV